MIDFLLLNLEVLMLLGFGFGALASAVLMLVLRQPMRVAMALITTMVFLAGIYGLLGVHVIAVFQVLIYVGAVMVFMVYVILLLELREAGAPIWSRSLVFGLIGFALLLTFIVTSVWRGLPSASGDAASKAFNIASFSSSFLHDYWLHFELTSVLLLVAVVAALAIIKVSRRADAQARHG